MPDFARGINPAAPIGDYGGQAPADGNNMSRAHYEIFMRGSDGKSL